MTRFDGAAAFACRVLRVTIRALNCAHLPAWDEQQRYEEQFFSLRIFKTLE